MYCVLLQPPCAVRHARSMQGPYVIGGRWGTVRMSSIIRKPSGWSWRAFKGRPHYPPPPWKHRIRSFAVGRHWPSRLAFPTTHRVMSDIGFVRNPSLEHNPSSAPTPSPQHRLLIQVSFGFVVSPLPPLLVVQPPRAYWPLYVSVCPSCTHRRGSRDCQQDDRHSGVVVDEARG